MNTAASAEEVAVRFVGGPLAGRTLRTAARPPWPGEWMRAENGGWALYRVAHRTAGALIAEHQTDPADA